MKAKKKLCAVITILMLLGIIACNSVKDNSVNALIIIVGRHANANAFHETFYEELEGYLKETVYGGYIGVISSEGTPRIAERFDYFEAIDQNEKKREKQIKINTDIVLDFLREGDSTYAITPENDLLKAIQEASALLNVFERQAKRDGKNIKGKRIIIMDSGIVTAGVLDFSTHGIDTFDSWYNDEKTKIFTDSIAVRLEKNKALPNLKGTNIVFIGLGDVARPQKELSTLVKKYGLPTIWTTIFNRAGVGADSVEILEFPSTNKANDANKLPPVRPIEFADFIISLGEEQIRFELGKAVYSNPTEAENNLKNFADNVVKYISRNPDVKIYVVGSESKDQDRQYTTALSEARAKTVMETLAKFGVSKNKMEAFGLAVSLPGRENDRPNNNFNSEIGKKNRKVVLIPSDIGDQAFLQKLKDTRDSLYGK